jgi:hypothetical protein
MKGLMFSLRIDVGAEVLRDLAEDPADLVLVRPQAWVGGFVER